MHGCLLALVFAVSLSFAAATPSTGQPLVDAARTGDLSALDELLAAGADTEVAGPIGTALHVVAIRGDTAAVERLIEAGADVNAGSESVGTPLLAALWGDRGAVALMLIAAGADVTAREARGLTALHFAAMSGDERVTQALIEQGADPGAIAWPRDGNTIHGLGHGPTTPLHLALYNGHSDVAERLREAGAGAKPVPTVGTALADASADRGRSLAIRACATCHQIEADGPNAIGTAAAGPPIHGVVGRPVASSANYVHSDALIRFGGVWDEERLFAFLLEPKLIVPGTKMAVQNLENPSEVADVIAFLRESTAP